MRSAQSLRADFVLETGGSRTASLAARVAAQYLAPHSDLSASHSASFSPFFPFLNAPPFGNGRAGQEIRARILRAQSRFWRAFHLRRRLLTALRRPLRVERSRLASVPPLPRRILLAPKRFALSMQKASVVKPPALRAVLPARWTQQRGRAYPTGTRPGNTRFVTALRPVVAGSTKRTALAGIATRIALPQKWETPYSPGDTRPSLTVPRPLPRPNDPRPAESAVRLRDFLTPASLQPDRLEEPNSARMQPLPMRAADTLVSRLFSRQPPRHEPGQNQKFAPLMPPDASASHLPPALSMPLLPLSALFVRIVRANNLPRSSTGEDRRPRLSDTPSVTAKREKKERGEWDNGREIMGSPRALRRQTSLPAHGATAFLLRIQRQGRAQTPGAEAEAAKIDAGELRTDLRRRGGPGAAVDFTIRQLLKPHLRFDPFMARLHRSPAAAGTARQLRADAFTIGADVFFGAEQPEANTHAGIGLLAHELTHVGQQMGAVGGRMRFFTPSGGDEMEREAQQTARRVTDSLPLSGPLHQGAFPARPALHFALPPQVQTFETEPPPSQTATAPRPLEAKPLSPVKRANARAVTDRVYELMQQEVALNRMRGGGQRWS